MKRRKQPKSVARPKRGALEDLIEQITVDACGDAEQLWAFRQAFGDDLTVPCAATIAGAPVTVVKFDFDGNERRGLTAKCRAVGWLATDDLRGRRQASSGRSW